MMYSPAVRFLTAAALASTCGLGAFACSHSALQPVGTASQKARAQTNDGGAAWSPGRGQVVSMSPSGLALPVFLAPQTQEERRFAVAAGRALRLVYDDDSDDGAQLQALIHRLASLPNQQVQAAWQPLLQAGLVRVQKLADHAPGLRALRQALADVYIDDTTAAVKRVDAQSCAQALRSLAELHRCEPQLMLTIEPLGPKSLDALLALCRS